MKKTIFKIGTYIIVFILTIVISNMLMNKDHNNMTAELGKATLPVVSVVRNGIVYNEMHGYTMPMDTALMRDTITILDKNKSTGFEIQTFGNRMESIRIEMRAVDNSRLIESVTIENYKEDANRIEGIVSFKDLIEEGDEYELVFVLKSDDFGEARYYTRAIWSSELHVDEKLAFAKDFHEKLYDSQKAVDLAMYIETNSALENNKSFANVNIHSTLRQMCWNNLPVEEIGGIAVRLTEIGTETATVIINYCVLVEDSETFIYYDVEEMFKLRLGARMFLLDYQRNASQRPDTETMFANDKVVLGITGEDVNMKESTNGNVVAYVIDNSLFVYNASENKAATVFSFYMDGQVDRRTLNKEHAIKILRVSDNGDVDYSVYGYMNRGSHEGMNGLCLYHYDSNLNTTEEKLFIPYNKPYLVMKSQMEELLYYNENEVLYITLDDAVYKINVPEKSYTSIVESKKNDSLMFSPDGTIVVWMEGEDENLYNRLVIRNLVTDGRGVIETSSNESIRFLGFMDGDVIYGQAYNEDITVQNSANIFFPMYKVCISDSDGEVLKNYRMEGIYVTDVFIKDNQITLGRVTKNEKSKTGYSVMEDDHIIESSNKKPRANSIVTADIDIFERIVQIGLKSGIDKKSLKIQTPKETVYEGNRTVSLQSVEREMYYVFGDYCVTGVFDIPEEAVRNAAEIGGLVLDNKGRVVWSKGNRKSSIQINEIKASKASGAGSDKFDLTTTTCINTIIGYAAPSTERITSITVEDIPVVLNEIPGIKMINLTGCTADSVLYYVNKGIPVLAVLDNKAESVLIVGFNEYNFILFEPSTGRVYKKGKNDSTAMFEENGNHFFSYIKE